MTQMKITLNRTESTDQGTFGVLTVGGVTFFTLELPWRDNQRMVSCIPPGEYPCVWGLSPRLKRFTYRVQGVPGRDGVLIHSANFAGDHTQGWIAQLNGCIALGKRQGVLKNAHGQAQKAILTSAPAVREFEALMASKPFTLDIK
jgi:hypothetical protein